MALIKEQDRRRQILGADVSLPKPEVEKEPTFLETTGAAYRLENFVGSFFAREDNLPGVFQQPKLGYDPYEDVDGSEPYLSDLVNVNSEEQKQSLIRQYDRETEDRSTIASSGATGVVMSMAMAGLDPINLIPVAGTAAKAKTAVEGMKSAAKVGLATSAISEVALQSTQVDRTMAETLMNISGSVILSGLLGGGMGAYRGRKSDFDKLGVQLKEDIKVPEEGMVDTMSPNDLAITRLGADTAGAAKFERITAEMLEPSPTLKIGETLSKFPVFGKDLSSVDLLNSPQQRLMFNSPSINSKMLTLNLTEFPLRLKGHEDGSFVSPMPIQREISRWNHNRMVSHKSLDENFVQYRLGRSKKALDVPKLKISDRFKPSEGKLTHVEFSDAVSEAIRAGGKHEIPEVQKVAETYNQQVFKPFADKMKELGRLPEDFEGPSGAVGYLSRVYDKGKISADPNGFLTAMERGVRELAEKGKLKIDPSDVDVLREVSMQIRDRILNHPEGRSTWDMEFEFTGDGASSNVAKALKGRKLTFADEIVQDYLVNDVEHLADMYVRSMAPDLALIGKFGSAKFDDIMAQSGIGDDYDKLIKDATPARAAKLEKMRVADERDLQVVVERMRNNFARHPGYMSSNSFITGIKSFNIMTKMGGILPSSFPDVARLGLSEASGPVFKDAITALTSKPGVFKVARTDANLMLTAFDMVLEGRAHSLFGIGDDVASTNKVSRKMAAGATNAMHLFGITKWNETMETVTSTLVSNKLFQAADRVAGNTATKTDLARLAEAGIDVRAARVISKQVAAHADTHKSVRIGRLDKWDVVDPQVADAYKKLQNAVVRDVERIIIAPGQDVPIWMSRPMGGMMGQFKTFGYASIQRSMLLYAQRLAKNPRDLATVTSLLSQIGLGVGVVYFKLAMLGQLAQTKDWDTTKWLMEGIDRSGVTGIVMDGNNMMERMSGGRVGLNPLVGNQELMTRYQQRNTFDAFLGPSAGTISDILTTVGTASGALTGDVTQSDIKAMRRLLPLQNYFVIRGLLDAGQEELVQGLNIPKSEKVKRKQSDLRTQ